MRRLPQSSAVIAASVGFLLLGFGLFCSSGHDDSHITYWAAHALQKLGQIVNYNGERVEQSSSLAHVILLALLGMITRVSLPTLGPITSIVSGVVALVLVGRLARLAAPGAPRGAELLVGTAACFVYWGFGGLETTLVAAAAVWTIAECSLYLDQPSRAGLGRSAAAMTLYLTARPESPLVLGCVVAVAIVYSLHQRRSLGPALRLAAVALTLTALLFGFRRAYFGALFPNPVYTKSSEIDAPAGLAYLWESLYAANLWLIAGVSLGLYHVIRGALTEREPRFAAVLSAAFALAYLSFIVLAGGDWMSGGRFVAHALPVLCVVTMIGLERAIASMKWRRAAVALAVALNLYGVLRLMDQRSSGRPIWTTPGLRAQLDARIGDRGYSWFEVTSMVHLRDATISAKVVDLVGALRAKVGDRKLVMMSSQAGMVPYHAFKAHPGALRLVDTCSLATRDFLRCLPADDLDRRQVCAMLTFDRYFDAHERIDGACGTRRPDLVFGLGGRGIEAILRRSGYTIVFEQKGAMRSGQKRKRGSGYVFVADEFVAVDTALLDAASLEKTERWTWDIY